METAVTAVIELGLLVLAYYLTFSLMLVGGGMMVGGPVWAGAVARLLFVRPVQVLAGKLLAGCLWLLSRASEIFRWSLRRTWELLRDFLLWPAARGTLAILRLAAVGFADTLHFLFTGRGQ